MTTTSATPPASRGEMSRLPWLGSGLKTVGKRLLQLVILLFVLSTLLFFLLRLSGDPAALLAPEDASPELLAAISQEHGLDEPLITQYFLAIANMAQLDFGQSLYTGEPAGLVVLSRVPATASLAAIAVGVTALIAIPVGVWLGAKRGGAPRSAATVVISILQGTPGFVTGLVLIQIFAVWWGLLPSVARGDPLAMVLPVLTLASFLVPQLVRVLSANTRELMGNDFVQTARANGASSGQTLIRHVLPNALLSTAALLGAQFAALLSGALITEYIFAWPGLGQLLINSVQSLDFPVVQASVFYIAVMVFVVNIAVDFIFQVVDPRLRRKVVQA